MTLSKIVLASLNYIIVALNAKAFEHSREQRDFWAMIAWCGSGTFWVWQVISR